MSRRGKGEGSIYKDNSRGGWIGEIKITLPTGEIVRKRCRGKTQREVIQKIDNTKRSISGGKYIEPSKITVKEWFNIWLDDYNAHIKQTTLTSYKSISKTHIFPHLGSVPLQRLKPIDIQRFINCLDVSPKTTKNIYTVLNAGLKKAFDMEYINSTPCKGIILPRRINPSKKSFTDEEVQKIFKDIKEHEPLYYNLCRIALFTGLRYAELLGLTWDCFDYENGFLKVYRQLQQNNGYHFGTLKNNKIRTVALPKIASNIIKSLDDGLSDFIFHHPSGEHFSYSTPRRAFDRSLQRLGINGTFHDLRHTYATNSLRAGDNPKSVQENMGHSTIDVTMEIYATVTNDMRRETQRLLQEAFKQFDD